MSETSFNFAPPKLFQTFPVRCCCSPKKIFGFLSLPALTDEERKKWKGIYKSLVDINGGSHTIKITEIRCNDWRELAIYSEEKPIGFWRNFKDFIEIHEPSSN